MAEATSDGQRLDKWLTYARFVKTRSLAQELVAGGKVRLNRDKVKDGARKVREGDVLTIRIQTRVHVVRVVGFAQARVPARDTPSLYETMDAGAPPEARG